MSLILKIEKEKFEYRFIYALLIEEELPEVVL